MAIGFPPAPPDLAGQELRRHYMNVALVWEGISGEPATDAEVVAGFAELNTEAAVSEPRRARSSWPTDDRYIFARAS